MPYQLKFEHEDGEWRIYLLGGDKRIGDLRSTLGGSWFGRMSLDGRKATFVGDDAQGVVDMFEGWIAAGMPHESELLTRKPAKDGAAVSADVFAKLRSKSESDA
jgi:hypothetical protein